MTTEQHDRQDKRNGGYEGWLRYTHIEDAYKREAYSVRCSQLQIMGESPVIHTARTELAAALDTMLGVKPREMNGTGGESFGIIGGTIDSFTRCDARIPEDCHLDELGVDGYVIQAEETGPIWLFAASDNGVLYAVYHLLRLLQTDQPIGKLSIRETPVNGLRMLDHWDNMDGTIERGYAGNSIFFRDNRIVADRDRIRDYARLLASVGINAVAINNVNVHREETKLITEPLLPDVAKVADVFGAYGIRLYLSVNFASPIEIGGLDTADPLHPDVSAWWRAKAKDIYRYVPSFGGFVVKADSEFRPGPFTYGRNHADGANMLADALAPFGGHVIWRCFVYNCLQDWRDRSTDRARAAYDHFKPLDGQFRDNVLLQIKNGPMDFQVREPVSPLFGGLSRTNQLLELQITQEYTGQQRHLCYLVPQWKEALDFDTFARGEGSTVASAASGALFGTKLGGMAAVSNVGDDSCWTGHPLAQANLFGFARLAWNPALDAEEIAAEWTAMTFGADPDAQRVITDMLLDSLTIYESYTAPLGVGWMVNPGHHYGPNVDGYEYSKWGTYHFADCNGIGVDRTVRSGTGYTGQYALPQYERYESLEQCPDELLLFFHHVPYTHKLKSGKTVIQHIYDTRFEGTERAAMLVTRWDSIKRSIDAEIYRLVRERLVQQAEHAKEWRDVLNTYFCRKSGIADELGRTIF
ncbi:alpha-glucuronidase family glycosyl hydrolase [Paenibacillus harenae]|uniref:alpha-glucuronidase family glycosyl hydrolase n=1 Tax=Paenibacillus harenae TaxID=306543 RepID=UPI002791DDAC|nr:alpha-glucuronidase family glycosyl hydrolase [Paenibacillus harenae]MDQ0059344.1 alpha-glucuronidase [Paenibacillus harenae]